MNAPAHRNFPDPNAQQRKAADPASSVWVSASAGSGKTKVLTDRVLTLLLTGAAPERILCITFTKAAASEMAKRISDRLGAWSTRTDNASLAADLTGLLGRKPTDVEMVDARRLFARVLDTPGGMKIQTVHAFCQSVLQRFPLEAGVSPNFNVLDDRDAKVLLTDATEWLVGEAGLGHDPDLTDAMAVLTRSTNEDSFGEVIAALLAERGRVSRILADHGSDLGLLRHSVCAEIALDPDMTMERLVSEFCDDANFAPADLRRVCSILGDGGKGDKDAEALMAPWLSLPPEHRAGMIDDYLLAYLKKSDHEIRAKLVTKKIAEAMPDAPDIMLAEAGRCRQFVETRKALAVAEATMALMGIGERLTARFERMKRLRNALDYDDLILKTRDLLSGEGAVNWVLYKLDGGIDHVLVDEAQDTNPEQWEIIERLTAEFFAGEGAHTVTPTVFAVGDGKQSIYSFQRADPREFVRMKDVFAEKAESAERKWDEVPLQISFRSTEAVLRAVDETFRPGHVLDGVALGESEIRHYAWREGMAGEVELWPPVDPEPADDDNAWKPPVEQQFGASPVARVATLIADDIARRIKSGEMLESRNRPLRAGDFLVLVRTRKAFVEHLVRELKNRDVAIAGVDRMVLKEQIAVMDLMALGKFLLLPDDDLNLACLLKSPLIGLEEDELFEIAWKRRGSLWEALKSAEGERFRMAADGLKELLGLADFIRPFELFERVLDAEGGRKRFLARLGPDCADPIDEFISLCIAYERSNTPSLQGFLQWFESGDVEIKRDPEAASGDAVRIMTVHGAKGLQAPVVYLPDTMQKPRYSATIQWDPTRPGGGIPLWAPMAADACEEITRRKEEAKDFAAAEYRRLLYVAMTRAEDRLYIAAYNNKQTAKKQPEDCWYSLMEAGLETLGQKVEDKLKRFDRPLLRYSNPQVAEPKEDRRDERRSDVQPLPDWARQDALPEPEPSDPLTPSRPDEEDPPVRSPLGADRDALRFKRGRLVHRLLQSLPDLPPERWREVGAAYLAQPGHRLEAEAQTALLDETLAVMTEPAFADLFTGAAIAEAPVVGLVETAAGPRVVSGQIDRIVVTAERIVILDYKTNRPPPTRVEDTPDVYLRQMALYRRLLEGIYAGRRVECALLWTDGPILMRLPDESMDRALP
jgi:ATP-dependent helicase/nuclease subunit A